MILAHLDRGEVKPARKLINQGLKQDPANASLAVLRDSLSRDPVELLGKKSFEYVVRPGDTVSKLAERFLGNRLLTYQLARYNAIERPDTLIVGQRLRIPGTLPAPATPPAASSSRRPAADEKPRQSSAPQPDTAPAAPAVTTDVAGAQTLRSQGLAALHRGQVAKAVELLQRATALDPANAVIKSDLARAKRIAANVRSRKTAD